MKKKIEDIVLTKKYVVGLKTASFLYGFASLIAATFNFIFPFTEKKELALQFCSILAISSIIISFTNIGGYFYFISSLILNSIFIFYAYVLLINPYNPNNENFPKEKKLFLYSIFYLFMLFLLLLIEHFTKLLFPSYLIMVKDLIWI